LEEEEEEEGREESTEKVFNKLLQKFMSLYGGGSGSNLGWAQLCWFLAGKKDVLSVGGNGVRPTKNK
jgi:hypothetical protein